VKEYEEKFLEKQIDRPKVTVTHGAVEFLEPQEKSVASALKMEIIRLTAENDVLRARMEVICQK